MFVCADGVVMKRLILLILLFCSLGMFSQELALSQYDGTPSTPHKKANVSVSDNARLVDNLDGLSETDLSKHLQKEGIADKLIEKANAYFDKMWYAEAARMFDIVLEKTEAEHTLPLLSKAGDSHYYIGNLEKSYKWYNELYQLYQNEMQDDTFLNIPKPLREPASTEGLQP